MVNWSEVNTKIGHLVWLSIVIICLSVSLSSSDQIVDSKLLNIFFAVDLNNSISYKYFKSRELETI